MDNPFGKSKYGEQNKGNANYPSTLEDGENVFRVVPAFASLAAKGAWGSTQVQHWGARGEDKKNPGKTYPRNFKCPKEINFNTKMVLVACEKCAQIEQRQSEYDAIVNSLKAQGLTPEQVETKTAGLLTWLEENRADRKTYINTMNEKREFKVRAVPYSVYAELDKLMDKLTKTQRIDPIDFSQGVWFKITKTGKKFGTKYAVEAVEESFTAPDGGTYVRAKQAPLTQDEVNRAAVECRDLPTVLRALTAEQISQLVTGTGDPEDVDRIFDGGTKREQSPPPRQVNPPVPAVTAAKPTPAPTQPAATDATDEEAALLKALAEARARKAAQTAPAPVQVSAPLPVPVQNASELSNEDFLKMFPRK